MTRVPPRLGCVRYALLTLLSVVGCADMYAPPQSAGPAKPRTTDQVGEFNAADGREIVSADVNITNPLTGALEAYQPLKQQIAGLGVDHAVNLFYATEGRYPKDHAEFMQRIIQENQLRLPALPQGLSYQYDVQNHKLVVVRDDTGARVD